LHARKRGDVGPAFGMVRATVCIGAKNEAGGEPSQLRPHECAIERRKNLLGAGRNSTAKLSAPTASDTVNAAGMPCPLTSPITTTHCRRERKDLEESPPMSPYGR